MHEQESLVGASPDRAPCERATREEAKSSLLTTSPAAQPQLFIRPERFLPATYCSVSLQLSMVETRRIINHLFETANQEHHIFFLHEQATYRISAVGFRADNPLLLPLS